MKIKTATLIGLIGAITSLVVSLYFLAYNTGIISFFVDTLDFFPLNLVYIRIHRFLAPLGASSLTSHYVSSSMLYINIRSREGCSISHRRTQKNRRHNDQSKCWPLPRPLPKREGSDHRDTPIEWMLAVTLCVIG